MDPDAIVIGAGATGVFTALDLASRGVSVLVLDKGGLARGTSGRYHGLIHSGSRYAVTDRTASKECMEENEIISRIAPHSIVNSGGFYVALKDDEIEYIDKFVEALHEIGIPHRDVSLGELQQSEPFLGTSAAYAVEVPDKTADPFRLLGGAALLAKRLGARFRLNTKVTGLDSSKGLVKTVMGEFSASSVVNAAGPWGFEIARMAGREIAMVPTVGVMLVYREKLVRHIISRLRVPSDGDLIVPFYDTSILGTTAMVVEDPDNVSVSEEDVESLVEEGSQLVPALKKLRYARYYFSVRPLLGGGDARTTTRDFDIIENQKVISVIGGKLTTSRLMGEKVADLVCQRLGIGKTSMTKDLHLPDPLSLGDFQGAIGDEYYSLGLALANLENAIQE